MIQIIAWLLFCIAWVRIGYLFAQNKFEIKLPWIGIMILEAMYLSLGELGIKGYPDWLPVWNSIVSFYLGAIGVVLHTRTLNTKHACYLFAGSFLFECLHLRLFVLMWSFCYPIYLIRLKSKPQDVVVVYDSLIEMELWTHFTMQPFDFDAVQFQGYSFPKSYLLPIVLGEVRLLHWDDLFSKESIGFLGPERVLIDVYPQIIHIAKSSNLFPFLNKPVMM